MDEAITCLPLVAFIISAIAISVYLSKRLQGSKFKTQQAEFQWSISGDCMDMKKSLKHGVDLKNLERENLSQIAYLTITQKKYQILRCMSGWNVCQLNRLYLRDNNILSIEPITKINMPHIEVLVLSDNKISSLKSLRKLPTLKLIWLELQNNPLSQELTFLSQMRLANLHYMWVEFFNSDKQFNDDLSWLSKCQSIILTKFYSSSAKRIVVEKFIDVMERKYLNFDIKMH